MAKPVVDRLERRLGDQADVLRVDVTSDTGLSLAKEYGVRGLPTLLVFDGKGQVVYSQAGMPDVGAITAAVEQAAGR